MSTEMSRSKSQAVYSFLPHMWVASRGDAQSVTAEIIGWNYLKMDNIYQNFIEGEIKSKRSAYLVIEVVIYHLLISMMVSIVLRLLNLQ